MHGAGAAKANDVREAYLGSVDLPVTREAQAADGYVVRLDWGKERWP